MLGKLKFADFLELEKKISEKISLPPKKRIYEFWNKNLKKNISSYFSFVLALKTIDAQMLFWSVFLKTHK